MVERKINQGNIGGAVRILASDDTVAPPTAEVYDMSKAKQPPDKVNAVYPPAPSADDPTATTVTKEEVLRAITSFPSGSAAGLDGLRPQHLKDMVGHSAGEAAPRLLGCLAKLLTVKLQGGVTADICPILYGAALTALRKKDGGIRPIAVGIVLRRLARGPVVVAPFLPGHTGADPSPEVIA